MAQGLVLLAYNAYYNRFLKSEASLADYITNSEGSDYLIQNVNFNPSDGLNTSHIIGKGELDHGLSFTDYSYTYALVIEYNSELKTRDEIYADEDTRIISKWFILDNDRTRSGQYKIDLRRDVLVDYMKQIKKSPIFVEKGIISDFDSPLLMNNEDVRLNQIKKEEILLKDRTECPWLVLYVKKGTVGEAGSVTVDVPQNDDFVYEKLNVPINQWQYWDYTQAGTNYKKTNRMDFRVHYFWINMNNAYIYKMSSLSPYPSSNSYTIATRGNLSVTNITQAKLDNAYQARAASMINRAVSDFSINLSDPLSVYNGKIIKDSDGKCFKVYVTDANSGQEQNETFDVKSDNAPLLKSIMLDAWREAAGQPSSTADDRAFQVRSFYNELHITLEELTDVQTTIDFSFYEGTGTKDSMLFDAICMPYGDVRMFASGGLIDFYTSAERSLRLMNSLATQLTDQKVLDFQILPYCPVPDLINPIENKRIRFEVLQDTVLECVFNGEVTDLIIVCGSSNITFDLNYNISLINWDDVPETMFRKYLNDCTMLRICSPNYNGLFEMNLAKNGGAINKFNVDMTLRPFNPYIHVNPDFNFLYGQDFNDQRGLICGGDFSLGIINDAWNVYEIQNKNYQAIFDRQIQNLDVNNAIARQEAGWGMAAGVVSGAASGAAGGAIVGGGWGALAGAVIGAGTSAVGGAMDLANLQKRQQETRSYAIDNYNLQLGNVQALPYSITKTSALTLNNKLFPFVEIYECSDEERLAYYDKIYWNGMTIGIIDRIEKYQSGSWANYFRGKLIALYGEEGSNAVENRIIEAINMELMKGVFI